jgi:hypothetical protein
MGPRCVGQIKYDFGDKGVIICHYLGYPDEESPKTVTRIQEGFEPALNGPACKVENGAMPTAAPPAGPAAESSTGQ